MAISGNCLLVAWRDAEPVGFALGWLGWGDGVHFHSHQVGVMAGGRGGGVGYALKLAQRRLCLDNGITEMRWTFDPMLRSNARFNLQRLGARVVAFLPHCYGDRRDAFNTGDTTDRLEVSWSLDADVGGVVATPTSGQIVIEIPSAYHSLRESDRTAADAARRRVGDALHTLFSSGGSVVGLGDTGYVATTGR
jgi:predicted GNAT superfamily acetyltransferase